MTTLTDTQVITASGGLVELGYSQITSDVSVTGTSTAQTQIIAPLTVVCDGSPILIEFFSANVVSPGSQYITIALWEDGVEKTRYWAASGISQQQSLAPKYRLTPSAGSHTYAVRAFVTGGTGTVAAGTGATTASAPAFLRVSKIVQATQWPAVTTGTIICTSSTRPAAPFEGQTIYETDTKKTLTYNGSGWYAFCQAIGRAQSTSSFATSASPGHTTFQDSGLTTSSISYAANRRIRVTLYSRPYPNGGLQLIQLRVLSGASEVAFWSLGEPDISATQAPYKSLVGIYETSSSGNDVFKAQIRAAASNTQVTDYYSGGDGMPRSLVVEDIGPA